MKFKLDGQEHTFDESRITFAEGRALEKVTGYAFGELPAHADAGELTVIQAMVWTALKREQPTLTFSDLDDMNLGDFEFEAETAEGEPDPTEPVVGPSSTDGPSTTAG